MRSGLAAGEDVVTSGQFLIDSESKLQEAVQKMIGPAQPREGQHRMGASTVDNGPMQPVAPEGADDAGVALKPGMRMNVNGEGSP